MQLDFDTKKLANKIENEAAQAIRKIIMDGMKGLVKESPVDTARFKCNWSTSVDNMHNEIFPEPEVKTSLHKLSCPPDFKRTSKGIAGYKLGQTMFLHNNLEYAIPLEYGTLTQAPRGWIRNTANLIQKKLNEIKNLL